MSAHDKLLYDRNFSSAFLGDHDDWGIREFSLIWKSVEERSVEEDEREDKIQDSNKFKTKNEIRTRKNEKEVNSFFDFVSD